MRGELLLLMIVFFSLGLFVNKQWSSPLFSLFNRWFFWGIFAMSFGIIGKTYFQSGRPFVILVAIGFLVWLLLETFYHWLTIRAFSRSSSPLFPRYVRSTGEDNWPNQRRYVAVRQWLRAHQFFQVEVLKANVLEFVQLRTFVYQNQEATKRIYCHFMPLRKGEVSFWVGISSKTKEGLFLTDNYAFPLLGHYPKHWFVVRKPLIRSMERLYAFHLMQCRGKGRAFEEGPLEEMRKQQRILEWINTEKGFFFPANLHENCGRLTQEGRYHFWKGVWLLRYFGVARV